MTDIVIKVDQLVTFLKLDKAWRKQLSQERLVLPSEYELIWLSQSAHRETHAQVVVTPKLPVRVHDDFVDFLNERGFPCEAIGEQ